MDESERFSAHSVETTPSNGNSLAKIEEAGQAAWGTNAVILKSPWSKSPSVDDMLRDSEHTLALNRFYLVGGEDRPATPTECRIAVSSDALHILFRCEESGMSFPYANLDKKLWTSADWYSLQGLPSASNNWPPNPDEVDFLIQPDTGIPSYYQFAATPQGLKFGCNRLLNSNTDASADQAATDQVSAVRVNPVEAFEASITRKDGAWWAYFQIPWQTLGGEPKSHFGFLPMRTRWRDGANSRPPSGGGARQARNAWNRF